MTMTPELEEQLTKMNMDAVADGDLTMFSESSVFFPGKDEVEMATDPALGSMPMKVTQRTATGSSVDKMTIYRTANGEPEIVLVHHLAAIMRKRRISADGTPVLAFSLQPQMNRVIGPYVCFLHPDSEERPVLDEIGLKDKTCGDTRGPKTGIASLFDREGHAQSCHKRELAAYKAHLETLQKAEDRAFQRAQLEAMQRMSGMAPVKATPQKRMGRPPGVKNGNAAN